MENLDPFPISKTVFVTGANGYIGRAVAVLLSKKGFRVYGLVRTEEKAKEAHLMEEEVIPVIGEANKPQPYKDVIKKAGIIIECASTTHSSEIMDNLMKSLIEYGKDEKGNKRLYI